MALAANLSGWKLKLEAGQLTRIAGRPFTEQLLNLASIACWCFAHEILAHKCCSWTVSLHSYRPASAVKHAP